MHVTAESCSLAPSGQPRERHSSTDFPLRVEIKREDGKTPFHLSLPATADPINVRVVVRTPNCPCISMLFNARSSTWPSLPVARFFLFLPFFGLCSSIHRNTQLAQLHFGRLDLAQQLLVRLGAVVEGHDAPAKLDEKVCAEGDEGPERQLLDARRCMVSGLFIVCFAKGEGRAYHGDDLRLDDGWQWDESEVQREVDLAG